MRGSAVIDEFMLGMNAKMPSSSTVQNAAVLPQVGEMLSPGRGASAAPSMSVSILVTQFVMMCFAPVVVRFDYTHGLKPLVFVGFKVLLIRALLPTISLNRESPTDIQLLMFRNAIFDVSIANERQRHIFAITPQELPA